MKTELITKCNELIKMINADSTRNYYPQVCTVCAMMAEYIGNQQEGLTDSFKYATYECVLLASSYLEADYRYLPPTQVARALMSAVEILNNL